MKIIEVMTAAVELLARQEFNKHYSHYRHPYADEQQAESEMRRLRAASEAGDFEKGCKVAIRSYFRLADAFSIDAVYDRNFAPFQRCAA